jgi:phosphatidylglycerol---prolipoprotein diacylglyceryl transferase
LSKLSRFVTILILIIFLGYFLTSVFSGSWVLQQSFGVGPVTIHYYGIILALAVLGAFLLAKKRREEYGLEEKQAEDIIFWTIIGGFVGARLYHVISSVGFYLNNPTDILKVWNGGLSIYGAVIGGAIVLILASKIFNLKSSILNLLDWLVPSLLVGQIIGRFGNLFNYEAYGYPTNLPWKMFVPEQFRPAQYQNFNFFHPWFLYEVLGNLFILVIVLIVSKRAFSQAGEGDNGSAGKVVFLYLLLYNVLRFCLEFLRIDSTFISGFRLNAVVSLIVFLIAAGVLFRKWKNTTKSSP